MSQRNEEIKEAMTSYAERLRMVRKLSAPSLEEVESADDYSRLLLHNFRKIGELAGENAEVLNKILMPFLQGEEALSEEDASELDSLNELLLGESRTDVLDTHLAEMINNRLNASEEKLTEETSGDPNQRVHDHLTRMFIRYERMGKCWYAKNFEESARIRKLAIEDYLELLNYLDKDAFLKLSPKARRDVRRGVMFGVCLYELEDPREMIRRIKKQRELFSDPFYHEHMPDFSESDWKKYLFDSYMDVARICASDELDEELYREAYDAFCECKRMLSQPGGEGLADVDGYGFVMVVGLCAAIKCADPSAEQLLSEVVEYYEKRDVSDYSYGGGNENLAMPSQIYYAVDTLRQRNGGMLSERLLELQRQIPYEVMLYYSNARLGDMAIPFVNHLTNFLSDFSEVPGGIRCSELCMRSLAAIHPPTYIHSNMVAKFTLCLTRHLLCRHPELFVNFPRCGSVEAVTAANDQILDYAYQAALYHDIGKLTIIDIIAMYGRRLLDTEFLELKKHPDNGAELAARFDSLKDYADVMRGHHLWYDGSRGYPLNFKAAESPYKTIIDIVTVADCMDAATDRVGRSYSKGKTIEEFTKEIEEGAGTHYAPFMAELLAEPAVAEDIRYLLDEGRSKLYRDTFNLLVDLLHKGKSGQD